MAKEVKNSKIVRNYVFKNNNYKKPDIILGIDPGISLTSVGAFSIFNAKGKLMDIIDLPFFCFSKMVKRKETIRNDAGKLIPTGKLITKEMQEPWLDSRKLMQTLQPYRAKVSNTLVFIEEQLVNTIPQNQNNNKSDPGKAAFSRQFQNYGKLISVIELAGIPYCQLYPISWKSKLGLNKDNKDLSASEVKKKSLNMAKQLFPEMSNCFNRQRDHNAAESALIGYAGIHHFLPIL